MIYLDENDIRKIIKMKEVMDGIYSAYDLYEKEGFNMPDRFRINDNDNTLVLMPCFTQKYITTKLNTIFPGNLRINMPSLQGVIALHSNENGKIKAIMDGTYITNIRTAAVGGLAIKYLAKKDSKRLAIIGAGKQGYYQTIAACEAISFDEVYIYNRTKGEKIEKLIRELEQVLSHDVKIYTSDTAQDAVQKSDVIITATNSDTPVLPEDTELYKGKLVVGIGSYRPNMREFPKALIDVTTKMYFDNLNAIKETGDIVTPLQKGWISRGKLKAFSSYLKEGGEKVEGNKAIIFKSTGMALFDAVISEIVYEKSIKSNVGIRV